MPAVGSREMRAVGASPKLSPRRAWRAVERLLTPLEIDHFEQDGFVIVREAVSRDVVAGCEEIIWREAGGEGVDRADRSTWTRPVVRFSCPECVS